MTKPNQNRLPAEGFCYLGRSLFGDRGWQKQLSDELKTDLTKVKKWAKEGAPGTIGKKLTKIAIDHRGEILSALTHPDMPQGHLRNSRSLERAAFLLQEYEDFLPYHAMETPNDDQVVARVIADLLLYCSHKKIPFEPIMREAEALHNFDPQDLIPYVLAEDPATIAEFKNKFKMTLDQAVDILIEYTDWGEMHLPQFYRRHGTPSERLHHLRSVIIEGRQREEAERKHPQKKRGLSAPRNPSKGS